MARAMASDSEVIDRYFNMLEDCLRSNGILNKQACIFNCDETGVPLKVGNIFLAFFLLILDLYYSEHNHDMGTIS